MPPSSLIARSLLMGLFFVASAAAQPEGKILRPSDRSAFASGHITIIATAPEGTLELDGKPVPAEAPFPAVLHARVDTISGAHTLVLIWPSGRQQIRFFVGPNFPADYKAFRMHPPAEVECTQCHGMSRRGRFVFKGGCFDCHQQANFVKTHQHTADVLESCGQCHNAHGSTEKSHLLLPREKGCKLCHN